MNEQSANKEQSSLSPALVCSVLTLWIIIGIIISFIIKSPLLLAVFLLPIVIYEIIRTKGEYTSISSWIMLAIIIGEIIFIVFGINYDLGQYLGSESVYIAGQSVPLGDIKVMGPALMAIFSLILLVRTYGPYTKWLAVLIFATSFFLIYLLSPDALQSLIQMVVNNNSFNY